MSGFDLKTFRLPSVEDIDLGYRLKDAGYRICLDKSLQVKHLKEWRSKVYAQDRCGSIGPYHGQGLCSKEKAFQTI